MKNAPSTNGNDEKFKIAQEVLSDSQRGAYAGFNRRVFGEGFAEAFPTTESKYDRASVAGWELANRMIEDGRIFYVHNFHLKPFTPDRCFAFQYGGTWVCNGCGQKDLLREWWKIKVMKDGNAWCCIGTGFEDLQASDNYAFGNTRDEAIENYGRLMLEAEKVQA